MKKLVYTDKEVTDAAAYIINNVAHKFLCFYGEMGAGKTTLIKAIVTELGGQGQANSPTFGIVNEYYDLKEELIAYHFDFYRLNDEVEAYDIGIEDYFESPHWKLIEWPEKVEKFLPMENSKIQLTKNQNGSRTINLEPVK